VDPPSGDEPIGLDMIHMGKGLAWLNGEEIGRYWPRKSSIHGANLCQISATLDVESQHKDGKAKLTYPKKGVVDPCILSSFLSIAAKLQSLWRFLTEHA